jgi:hypothetical protein
MDEAGKLARKERADLAARIAGMRASETFGEGLVGRSMVTSQFLGMVAGGGALATTGDITLAGVGYALGGLVGIAVTSPRAVSHLAIKLGATQKYAKNVEKITGMLLEKAGTKGMAVEGLMWGDLIHRLSIPDEDRKILENNDKAREEATIQFIMQGFPIDVTRDMVEKDFPYPTAARGKPPQ